MDSVGFLGIKYSELLKLKNFRRFSSGLNLNEKSAENISNVHTHTHTHARTQTLCVCLLEVYMCTLSLHFCSKSCSWCLHLISSQVNNTNCDTVNKTKQNLVTHIPLILSSHTQAESFCYVSKWLKCAAAQICELFLLFHDVKKNFIRPQCPLV